MKKNSGFTLIELVVVMVILAILAVISVPMYRNYVTRAIQSEGRALIGQIVSTEKVWHLEHNTFRVVAAGTAWDPVLEIDARGNTYFRQFGVAVPTPNDFVVTVEGTHADAPWDIVATGDVFSPMVINVVDQ